MDRLLQVIKQYYEQILANWNRLRNWQKIALSSAVAVVIITLASFLFMLPGGDDFGVLFGDLTQQDAAAIVNRLKEENITYRLDDQGGTIMIQKDKIYETRLTLASEGMPQSGIVGYEIFDKNNIGVTDFVQQLNYKRALEGELARTIQSIQEIRFARVHIMIPKPSLFIEDETEATSSVMLHLQDGQKLNEKQVEGVANLVSSSVEGLETNNVTIVDSKGSVLTKWKEKNSIVELTASQLELQMRVEKHLEDKLGNLLFGVVGPDNYMVRVNSELDFNRVERTMESYDPESSTIRSQESNRQTNQDQDPAEPSTEDVITNYEISKSIERVIGSVGNIKRLSVAVMVDGSYQVPTGAEGAAPQYVPRTDEEIQKITNLVQNAVGLDATRGDQIQVTNIPFDTSQEQRTKEFLRDAEQWELLTLIGKHGSIAIALVIFIYLLRGIFQQMQPKIQIEEEEEEIDLDELEMPIDTQLKMHKRRIVTEIARDKPQDMAKLVRSWLFELSQEENDDWSMRN